MVAGETQGIYFRVKCPRFSLHVQADFSFSLEFRLPLVLGADDGQASISADAKEERIAVVSAWLPYTLQVNITFLPSVGRSRVVRARL